jgi:hypothetical protein
LLPALCSFLAHIFFDPEVGDTCSPNTSADFKFATQSYSQEHFKSMAVRTLKSYQKKKIATGLDSANVKADGGKDSGNTHYFRKVSYETLPLEIINDNIQIMTFMINQQSSSGTKLNANLLFSAVTSLT